MKNKLLIQQNISFGNPDKLHSEEETILITR